MQCLFKWHLLQLLSQTVDQQLYLILVLSGTKCPSANMNLFIYLKKHGHAVSHVSETRNWGHDTQVPSTVFQAEGNTFQVVCSQHNLYRSPIILYLFFPHTCAARLWLWFRSCTGSSTIYWVGGQKFDPLYPWAKHWTPSWPWCIHLSPLLKKDSMEMRECGPKCRQRRWRWALTESKDWLTQS